MKCRKILTNVLQNFPQPNVMYSNCIYDTTNSPKPKRKESSLHTLEAGTITTFLWTHFLSAPNALIDSSLQLWCCTQFSTSEFWSMLHSENHR